MRECLKLDPEHKECFPHYKKVKKVAKIVEDLHKNANENNYQGCISSAKKVLRLQQNNVCNYGIYVRFAIGCF